jgi:glycosyltransferase involved in cell wall biosynthesis
MDRIPRVSVIIPAYNAADTLKETMESVAAQTFRDFELVAVDDGSTDATPEVLAEHAAKWPWMRWERQPNGGAAAARNRAIELARGEFIAMLDADDLWMPDKLAAQMDAFARNAAAACVYTDEIDFLPDRDAPRTLFQEKPPARGRILRQLFPGNFVLTSSLIVRKAALDQIGGFDASHRVYEDLDLFLRLADRFEFDYVDRVLVRRRILPNSLMHGNALACQQRDLEIIDEWVARRPDLFPQDSPHVRRRRASVYARMGYTLLSMRDFRGARHAYRRAIALGEHGPGVLARAAVAHVPVAASLFRLAKEVRKRLLRR